MSDVEVVRGAFHSQMMRQDVHVLTSPSLVDFFSGSPAMVFTVQSNSFRELSRLVSSVRNMTGTVILAVGAGRVLDVSKCISHETGLPLIAFPTVLSGNSFATDRSVLKVGTLQTTVESRSPDKVILDPDLLDRVPSQVHLAGLADVVAIHTAGHDWDRYPQTSETAIPDSVSRDSLQLLNDCVAAMPTLDMTRADGYRNVSRLLSRSAELVTRVGSGRAVSGSEHRIASRLVAMLPTHAWHGDVVALGILIASDLQGRSSSAVSSALRATGFFERLLAAGLDTGLAIAATSDARRIRPDRRTVLDDSALCTRASIHRAVETVFDQITG